MRLFSKPLPPTDNLLMLMMGQVYEEIQQLRQQQTKDKNEILTAIQNEHGTNARTNKG